MRYKIYTGIVLQHRPLREADEVITVWSWEEGKVRLLVRSVRRSESKLKRVLMPLSWLEFCVVPSDYLPVVVSVRTVKNSRFSTDSLEYLALVFNLFEMVLRATPDRQPNDKISVLLRESWDYLESAQNNVLDFLINFRRRLLLALGYDLRLDQCGACHSEFRSFPLFINRLTAELICNKCRGKFIEATPLKREVWNYLTQLQKQPSLFPQLKVSHSVKLETDELLSSLFNFFTERRLNSQRFLKENITI